MVYGLSLVILSACGQTSFSTPTLTALPAASPTTTVTLIATNTTSPEPTPTSEVRQFQDNDVEHWHGCYIAPAVLVSYADFRKEQLRQQDLALPEVDPLNILPIDFAGQDSAFIYVKYDGSEASISERPYFPGDRFCYTEADVISATGQRRATFAVTTVAFPVPGKMGEFIVNAVLIKQFNGESDEDFILRLKGYLNDWSIFSLISSTNRIEPIATQNELAFPDWSVRFDKFIYNRGDEIESTMDPTSIEGIIFESVPLWIP